MARTQVLTALGLVLAGLAVALWLAATRLPETPPLPVSPDTEGLALAAPADRPLPAPPPGVALPELDLGRNGLPCDARLFAEPAPGGLVRLGIDAPCHAGAVAEIRHGPLRFAGRLTSRGSLRVELPVLRAGEGFGARLGDLALAAEPVSGTPAAAVSGLVWDGPLRLRLAAHELGAGSGEPGHELSASESGLGRVFRFGDPALGAAATLYSAPASSAEGRVRFTVAAFPAPNACPEDLPIQAFETAAHGIELRDIRLSLGVCDGPTPSVELKYLLDDLTLPPR